MTYNNMRRWLTYIRLGVICGRHSNIPWHCILWYVTVDWYFRSPPAYRLWMKRWGRRGKYIQCPYCVLTRRHPNPLRKCDETCTRTRWLRNYMANKDKENHERRG